MIKLLTILLLLGSLSDAKTGSAVLHDSYHPPLYTDVWYRISHRLGGSVAAGVPGPCRLAQWMPDGETGRVPPLAHDLEDGEIQSRIAFALADDPEGEPVSFDFFSAGAAASEVHDFVYHVVWPDGGIGLVEAWHNGKYIGLYRGPLGYPGAEHGPVFNSELTCAAHTGPKKTSVVYTFRHGPTRDAVLGPGETLETPVEYSGF